LGIGLLLFLAVVRPRIPTFNFAVYLSKGSLAPTRMPVSSNLFLRSSIQFSLLWKSCVVSVAEPCLTTPFFRRWLLPFLRGWEDLPQTNTAIFSIFPFKGRSEIGFPTYKIIKETVF